MTITQGNSLFEPVERIHAALTGVVEEMQQALKGLSVAVPLAAALSDERGFQLSACDFAAASAAAAIPRYVGGIMHSLIMRGDGPAPGDVILHNDVDAGAQCRSDLAVCVPAFYRDELIGFAVSTVRYAEIDAAGLDAEDLTFSAAKCVERGQRDAAVWTTIGASRFRQSAAGLALQIEVGQRGAAAYCELADRFGGETIHDLEKSC